MHSVDRECKAQERRRLIQRRACELVLARGYDGFTMEELADAVGVSRRTLFNSVPDKASAVLGPEEDDRDPGTADFSAGGPSGQLYADLVTMLTTSMDGFPAEPDAVAHFRLVERAVASDPKVHAMYLERTQRVLVRLSEAICTREGWPQGDLRATTLTATMFAMVRLALAELERRPDGTSLGDAFREVLAAHAAVLP